MKIIIFFSLIFPFLVQAECGGKVDPSKVILFIDVNDSEREIATAQKAACNRGERMVIVPKNYKEYSPYIKAVNDARKKADSLKCSGDQNQECQKASEAIEAAEKKLANFRDNHPSLNEALKATLLEVQKNKGKLQNVIISGHATKDENFDGHKGKFNRETLMEAMKAYPGIDEVRSLVLPGCYTATKKAVLNWLKIFPRLKMIAGYDGRGPLSERPQGQNYIADLLNKEKELYQKADEKKLQAYVKDALKSLEQVNSPAIYLECGDEKQKKSFYYASEAKKFEAFTLQDCPGQETVLQEINAAIQKYKSGELEPPKDTIKGELRKLYAKGNLIEHCAETLDVAFDGKSLFNLLFYENVKQNFAEYYEADLARAEKALSSLTLTEMKKRWAGSNLEAYEKQYMAQPIPWIPTATNLKKHTRKETLDNLTKLNNLKYLSKLTETERKAVNWVTRATETHLLELKNPLTWHEFKAQPEKPALAIRYDDENVVSPATTRRRIPGRN